MRAHPVGRDTAEVQLRRVSRLSVVGTVITLGVLTYVAVREVHEASLASASAAAIYGYLNRSTGTVALVLLTIVVVLGVLNVSRFATARWPPLVIDGLHRRVALLAVCCITLHVLTTVLNGYPPISLLYAVVPIHSAYATLWLGVGAAGFDLILVVLITSLARAALGYRVWRAIHWLTYACWVLAVAHTVGLGNDLLQGHVWMFVVTGFCIAVAVAAVVARLVWAARRSHNRRPLAGKPELL